MSPTDEFTPPFSRSADANKDHILEQLRSLLQPNDCVLEIGSGTGQHALHFTQSMLDILWQSSGVDLNSFNLDKVLASSPRPNLLAPLTLNIDNWPDLERAYDAVYSANCVHIISHEQVEPYVAGTSKSLKTGGLMLLYGPYKYGGNFTTQSNADFDIYLRTNYGAGGIKDFETIDKLANTNGLVLENDIAMPANNQFLVFRKTR